MEPRTLTLIVVFRRKGLVLKWYGKIQVGIVLKRCTKKWPKTHKLRLETAINLLIFYANNHLNDVGITVHKIRLCTKFEICARDKKIGYQNFFDLFFGYLGSSFRKPSNSKCFINE
jgi:hypothetical protein